MNLEAITVFCNLLHMVTWDRYVSHPENHQMVIYGWTEGDKPGRWDFVVLWFGAANEEGGLWCAHTTSSQQWSDWIDQRIGENFFTYAETTHEERSCQPVQQLSGLECMVPR